MSICVPWAVDASCCEGWDELDAGLRDRAEELAWSTLRALSGGRVGNCVAVMRPCLTAPCDLCAQTEWMHPHIRDGQWINTICGTPRCSCARMCEIVFPGPIAALGDVIIDGEILDPAQYRVDNQNRLIRQDGQCWPSCQHMELPMGDVGTMSIEYVPGIVPSAAGLWAAGTLACEFTKACTGGKCRLPSSVTSVARQGVQFTMSTGMFPDGMTGIREVDAYLTSINPNALKLPPMVWSPDVPWARHRWQGAV